LLEERVVHIVMHEHSSSIQARIQRTPVELRKDVDVAVRNTRYTAKLYTDCSRPKMGSVPVAISCLAVCLAAHAVACNLTIPMCVYDALRCISHMLYEHASSNEHCMMQARTIVRKSTSSHKSANKNATYTQQD
jgi:hypothetical protein